jgi:mRNA interferase MazF
MVKRGEIWWADLPEPTRSEPGFRRPVVIIQADSFNCSKINTVICAVITSNLKLSEAPGNIALSISQSGLSKESVINISQIITIDKSFLSEKISELNSKIIHKIEESLKLILAIG